MISKRVLVSLPPALLAAVDRQAKADFVSRSELMRRALLEYLRPIDSQANEEELYTDPEEVLRILQRRKLRHSLQKLQREAKQRRD
jgi:metal-responsive CopG/Arc/MetJ family transcriptional regulator